MRAVPNGMSIWPDDVARLLQPTRNRNVGVVAFFDQNIAGQSMAPRRRWRVVVNTHARIQVPEKLISEIESLDESVELGMRKPKRIVVGHS